MRRPGSNPPPPADLRKPPAPPPPPARVVGFFGETRASIRAGEDYRVFMDGHKAGYQAALKEGAAAQEARVREPDVDDLNHSASAGCIQEYWPTETSAGASTMKDDIKAIGWLFLGGAIMMAGMKAADHLIPDPEMRVVFCLVELYGTVEDCKPLAEWLDEEAAEVAA